MIKINKKMSYFSEKIAACYKRPENLNWKCNCSFDKLKDADEYLHSKEKEGMLTTVIPVSGIYPKFTQKYVLQQKLSPNVDIE